MWYRGRAEESGLTWGRGFPEGRGKKRHEESVMEFWCWEYCSDEYMFGDPFKEVTELFYFPLSAQS